tara:strand:- start:169 stop:438 length:270 start_codon:yes stop_codon:yes gene_type:complete
MRLILLQVVQLSLSVIDSVVFPKNESGTDLTAITSDVTDMQGEDRIAFHVIDMDKLTFTASDVESLKANWNIQLDFTFVIIHGSRNPFW